MSAGSTADAASTPAEHPSQHPSLQAGLAKAGKLFDAIGTQGAYDQSVQQRGSEALETEIIAVMTDICDLIASASDPQLRIGAIAELLQLLLIEHMAVTIEQKAIDAGVAPVLVEQLSGCEAVEKPATWALCMLARHQAGAAAVANAGAIPPLVQLVSSPDDVMRVAAIEALCVATVNSSTRRDAVLAAGILEPLLKVMRESSNVDVLTGGAYLLCYLLSVSENSPHPVPLAELVPFLPVLVGLIAAPQQDDNVLQCARGALQQFSPEHLGIKLSLLNSILDAGRQKQANEGLPNNPYYTQVAQAGGVDKVADLQTHNHMGIAAQALLILVGHFPARVDEQRVEALYQQHILQAAEEETNVGADD
ncbi:unnamed protein product [Vitrella brassicaformis CCMP3155]|uniref:Nucleotide exchange factor Fes1 domain-containing protein n=1 Tax=Vitrella brassicaformis (strain CCMP3155) TaxID=1169540 RepID=A0A0G4FK53_VITBC|nr:unnamed protein product [Vitrella brassicaformis CCMP3155]|eukprot:CEM14166.1 unnamed protein product [Vitrella brassicaformis CCMP3155]